MIGIKKLMVVHSMFYIACGTEVEKKFVKHFESCVESLGQILCGDEKLFWFTANNGFVRQVLSKPAQVGLWHYQAVVPLKYGGIFLIFTQMHNAKKNMGKSIPTVEIVKQWIDISKKTTTQML